MTLRERLATLMEDEDADYRALYEANAKRLGRTAARGVLKPGDRMPVFVLPDAEGEIVDSADWLAQGPLAVVFFRGDWCPYCEATLRALNEIVAPLRAAGGGLVALTADTGDFLLETVRRLELAYPVLCDVDAGVGLQFGTVYRETDAMLALLRRDDADLAERHGDASGFLTMPAAFVVDRAGIVRFAYVSGDVADRAEPETVLRVVCALAAVEPDAAPDIPASD
jgi:peroxiredoxin